MNKSKKIGSLRDNPEVQAAIAKSYARRFPTTVSIYKAQKDGRLSYAEANYLEAVLGTKLTRLLNDNVWAYYGAGFIEIVETSGCDWSRAMRFMTPSQADTVVEAHYAAAKPPLTIVDEAVGVSAQYTGSRPEPAGVVHSGEYLVPAPKRRRGRIRRAARSFAAFFEIVWGPTVGAGTLVATGALILAGGAAMAAGARVSDLDGLDVTFGATFIVLGAILSGSYTIELRNKTEKLEERLEELEGSIENG